MLKPPGKAYKNKAALVSHLRMICRLLEIDSIKSIEYRLSVCESGGVDGELVRIELVPEQIYYIDVLGCSNPMIVKEIIDLAVAGDCRYLLSSSRGAEMWEKFKEAE